MDLIVGQLNFSFNDKGQALWRMNLVPDQLCGAASLNLSGTD